MFNQILRPVARRAIQKATTNQTRSHGGGHGHGHSHVDNRITFDDACKPEGSWAENFAKQQKRYNTQLAVGVGAFVFTVAAILQGELLFFNYSYPKPKQ
ncbi:hypothetical protein TKK_0006008 [Trichogramma kaykai]|uniref:Deltamethrin resistance protein prag01 domain-containing protein n=1 Tax=Trichogramma kaykai TaxID=54128 RepID=A0ABD2XEY7_9HYME